MSYCLKNAINKCSKDLSEENLKELYLYGYHYNKESICECIAQVILKSPKIDHVIGKMLHLLKDVNLKRSLAKKVLYCKFGCLKKDRFKVPDELESWVYTLFKLVPPPLLVIKPKSLQVAKKIVEQCFVKKVALISDGKFAVQEVLKLFHETNSVECLKLKLRDKNIVAQLINLLKLGSKIKELYIMCWVISFETADLIVNHFSGLEKLKFHSGSLPFSIVQALLKKPQLKKLQLEQLQIDKKLKSFKYCHDLTKWDFDTVVDLIDLFPDLESMVIKGSTSVSHLSQESISKIFTLKNLKHLQLSHIDIGGKEIVKLVKKELAQFKLEHLEFWGCHIGEIGGVYLVKLLEKNNKLTHLMIADNKVGKKVGKEIAKALEFNNKLVLLNMRGNQLDDVTVKAFAEMLVKNSTLLYLNLGDNNITDVGVGYLAAALKKNKTLKALNLGHTNITSAGENKLKAMLYVNQTLEYLDIRSDITNGNRYCRYNMINRFKITSPSKIVGIMKESIPRIDYDML